MLVLVPVAFREGYYSSVSARLDIDGTKMELLEVMTYREFNERGAVGTRNCNKFEDEDSVLIALYYFDLDLITRTRTKKDLYRIECGLYSMYVSFSINTSARKGVTVYMSSSNVEIDGTPRLHITSNYRQELKEQCREEVTRLILCNTDFSMIKHLDDWCDPSKIKLIHMRGGFNGDHTEKLKEVFEDLASRLGRDCFSSLASLQGFPRRVKLFLECFDVNFLSCMFIDTGGSGDPPTDSLVFPKLEVDSLVTHFPRCISMKRVGRVNESTAYRLGHYWESELIEYQIMDLTHFTKTTEVDLYGRYYGDQKEDEPHGSAEPQEGQCHAFVVHLEFNIHSGAKSARKTAELETSDQSPE